MNENLVNVAIHQMCRRLKDLVALRIVRTLTDQSDQAAELADLIVALSQGMTPLRTAEQALSR